MSPMSGEVCFWMSCFCPTGESVAFFGREVIGGTECEDRASSDHVDAYSRSKRAAEDLILSADNKASFT